MWRGGVSWSVVCGVEGRRWYMYSVVYENEIWSGGGGGVVIIYRGCCGGSSCSSSIGEMFFELEWSRLEDVVEGKM